MGIINRERVVQDPAQLRRYMMRHRGKIDGIFSLPDSGSEGRADAPGQAVLAGSYALAVDPQTNQPAIEFRQEDPSEGPSSIIVDERSFAGGAVRVLSRHHIR